MRSRLLFSVCSNGKRQPELIPSSPLPVARPLKDSLRHSQSLRTAILYQEILGKPKALQGFRQ